VKREKWDCPRWLASAAVISLGTAPGVFFLLTRPSFYEVAISAGYCFVMAGFLLIAYSLEPDSPRAASLLVAGLCFGLAVGCRPDFALPAILMVLLAAWRIRAHKLRALAFAAPVVLCGVLLAEYNYTRFQNPFEFGVHYLLANGVENHGSFFALAKIVPAIYYLVFAPPWIGLHHPFVSPSDSVSFFGRLPKGFFVGPTIGLLWVAPIALFGLMTPLFWRVHRIRHFVKLGSTRFTIASLYSSTAAIMAVLTLLGWIVGRYLVDFAPELVLLSWLLLAAAWQGVRGCTGLQPRLFCCAVAGLALYSLFLDLWIRTT
jgi:hypothetical protein